LVLLLFSVLSGRNAICIKPIIEISFENLSKGESLFCHKTSAGSEPVYYFRFRVKNIGKSQVKKCEVVLENLWKPNQEGKPKKFPRFVPENLNTVPDFVGKQQYIDLNPLRDFYLDIGCIYRNDPGKNCQDVPDYREGGRPFRLTALYYFNRQPNCLAPCKGKKYFLQYGLYSENAGHQKVCFSISWTGDWRDDPKDMSNEIIIEQVACPNDT
jgi:hypothetical protein